MKFMLLILLLLFSACSSNRENIRPDGYGTAETRKLTDYARSLIGAPYRYGGTSPDSGFDCSGFVDYVFRRAGKVLLPHNSRSISLYGYRVASSELREGDLVFYDTNHESYSHVGIYLGDNRFIHAPSSGGRVRIEDMNLDYWKSHYNGARRITLKR